MKSSLEPLGFELGPEGKACSEGFSVRETDYAKVQSQQDLELAGSWVWQV